MPRNFTINRDVTASGISLEPETVGSYSTGPVDFAQVLHSHIFYSTDPSVSMDFEGLNEGPWSGHWFDISTMDKIEADKDVQWTDITEKLRARLDIIAEKDGASFSYDHYICLNLGSDSQHGVSLPVVSVRAIGALVHD